MQTKVATSFTKFNTNKKNETILEFTVRGELTDEQIVRLHRLKAEGKGVIEIYSSQVTTDEYEDQEEHRGIEYQRNPDGTVDVDPNQITLDEAANDEPDVEEEILQTVGEADE